VLGKGEKEFAVDATPRGMSLSLWFGFPGSAMKVKVVPAMALVLRIEGAHQLEGDVTKRGSDQMVTSRYLDYVALITTASAINLPVPLQFRGNVGEQEESATLMELHPSGLFKRMLTAIMKETATVPAGANVPKQ